MTLVQLFTAIANQIRRLKGTSGTIVASNFPTEMSEIELGKLTDEEYEISNDKLDEILEGSTPTTIYPPDWSEIGYSETPQDILNDFGYSKDIKDNWDSSVTSLSNKFAQDTTLKYMPLVDTSNATNMQACFSGCNNMQSIPLLNTSNVTNMQGAFQGCTKLKEIPLLDTGKVTNAQSMFAQVSNLKAIPQFDTKNMTTMFVMFQGCTSLEDVPILNTSKVTLMMNMFGQCTNLTNESLNNILEMCANSGMTVNKTLKYIGLTSAQATTCQSLSNYQAFLDAGWTTGY